MKKWIALITFLFLASIVLAIFLTNTWMREPLSATQTLTLVEYVKGSSLRAFTQQLSSQGILKHPYAFEAYARILLNHKKLYAGEYSIEPGMNALQLLKKIETGSVYLHALTIVEGTTFKELMQLIAQTPALDKTSTPFKGMDTSMISMEGLFLPETYLFPKHETDHQFLKRAYDALQKTLNEAFAQRSFDVPYKTPYEALIAASIVEKESAIADERGKIARVIINRLALKMPLQMDPTVIYGLGNEYAGSLTKKDLLKPTLYNTYLSTGLPPTPICLPSRESIIATLNPTPGNFLYFVAKGDGSHTFSSDLKEHQQAVNAYRQVQKQEKLP